MGVRAETVVLAYSLMGLVLIGIGIPLALERVRPNPWYGFRTGKTLSDRAIWYAANHIMGVDLIVAGAVLVICVFVMYLLYRTAIPGLPIAACAFGLFLLEMLATVVHGFWALSRM